MNNNYEPSIVGFKKKYRITLTASAVIMMIISAYIIISYYKSIERVYKAEAVIFLKQDDSSSIATSITGVLGGANQNGQIEIFQQTIFSWKIAQEIAADTELLEAINRYSRKKQEFSNDVEMVSYFIRRDLIVNSIDASNLVAVQFKSRSKELSALVLSRILLFADKEIRNRIEQENIARFNYLSAQLEKTEKIFDRQVSLQIMIDATQRLISMKSAEVYSFRVIDPPYVPTTPVWPNPIVIAAIGTLISGFIWSIFVVIFYFIYMKSSSHRVRPISFNLST